MVAGSCALYGDGCNLCGVRQGAETQGDFEYSACVEDGNYYGDLPFIPGNAKKQLIFR